MIWMRSFDDFNATFFFHLVKNGFDVLAKVDNTRGQMNPRRFNFERCIPKLHERQSREQLVPGATSAARQAHQFHILTRVPREFSVAPIKCYKAAGTSDTDFVHCPFTTDHKYSFHSFDLLAPYRTCFRRQTRPHFTESSTSHLWKSDKVTNRDCFLSAVGCLDQAEPLV